MVKNKLIPLQEGEEEEQLEPEEREKRAREITQSRILTQEEFKKLKLKQLSAHISDARSTKKKGKKRQADTSMDQLMEASS